MTEQSPMGFKRLFVEDWRQFNEVNIEFHPRLTVLTGANASGKSTLLALLARHFNWVRPYSSAPVQGGQRARWWIGGSLRRKRRVINSTPFPQIGSITYGTGLETAIGVPDSIDETSRTQYDLVLPNQQMVPGLFVSSHRLATGNYTPVPNIPAIFSTADQYFEQFSQELRNSWIGGWSGRPPQLAMKETLIAAAVFGSRGNDSVDFNQEASDIWNGFQEIIRQLAPASLGFKRLRVRVPDIVVSTETDDFILDEASGGLSAVFEMAWPIFLRSQSTARFTVVMDEPENHLHPSLQRELMPSLLRAFPRVQFVVATHSPFVVTAVQDSNVYVLDYDESRRVDSRRLDYANKAANADETLRRVLGLESTYPSWAVARFDRIVNEYMTGSMTVEQLAQLRAALDEAGLASEFPEAVVRISDSTEDDFG